MVVGGVNYRLFDGYLAKIKSSTASQFGSGEELMKFLDSLIQCGSLLLALKKSQSLKKLSLLEAMQLIHSDKNLAKCIELARQMAAEHLEAVLYDRAVNGYEELTFNAEGQCIGRKRKYCSKSLLEYLKANLPKYQNTDIKKKMQQQNLRNTSIGSRGSRETREQDRLGGVDCSLADEAAIPSFEVESFGAKAYDDEGT